MDAVGVGSSRGREARLDGLKRQEEEQRRRRRNAKRRRNADGVKT